MAWDDRDPRLPAVCIEAGAGSNEQGANPGVPQAPPHCFCSVRPQLLASNRTSGASRGPPGPAGGVGRRVGLPSPGVRASGDGGALPSWAACMSVVRAAEGVGMGGTQSLHSEACWPGCPLAEAWNQSLRGLGACVPADGVGRGQQRAPHKASWGLGGWAARRGVLRCQLKPRLEAWEEGEGTPAGDSGDSPLPFCRHPASWGPYKNRMSWGLPQGL